MKKRRGQAIRGKSRKSRTQSRPGLERFEDRLLMTIFVVSSVNDNANAVANDGSLRGAILASNGSTTALPNEIQFALPSGSTIFPLTALPAITEAVTIDGTSAMGYDPNNPKPTIEINGSKILSGTNDGLDVMAPGVTISAMDIDGFAGSGSNGIVLAGGQGTVIGTYVGVSLGGDTVVANGGVGILVQSAGNTIGSISTDANVVSGNSEGIQVTGSTATGNLITHSFIGTDSAGTQTFDSTGKTRFGNALYGIELDTGKNTVGGINSGNTLSAGNLISGNYAGIENTTPGSNGNIIEGNDIGTNVTGTVAIPNTFDGIDLEGVTTALIGGSVTGARNIISGNGFNGIQVSGSTTTNDAIEGNYIGIAANGTSALGNGENGVFINGASGIAVGGSTRAGNTNVYGNVIAFNGTNLPSSNGVLVVSGTDDDILSNSIYSNASIGIRLSSANAGITPPTLTTVESGAGETRISGTLSGQFIQPSTMYRIQFFSSQTPNPSGSGDGQNFLGDLTVTTNTEGVANFMTTLLQGVPVGDILSSTATQVVPPGSLFTNTSQFGPNVIVTQAAVTNLSVLPKPPAPAGPFLNQPYTFTFTVANLGMQDDTNVVFTDTIPKNSTFVSSTNGTFANGVLTDDIGTLAANSSLIETITVLPTSTTIPFVNTAAVTGAAIDTDLSNNTYTTTLSVADDADLVVNLTTAASPAPVGSPITYVLNIGNNGPSTASGVMTQVAFPTSYSSISVTTDQGSYTIGSDNTVTINSGILPADSSSTVTITATPLDTGTFNVTATTDSPTADPDTTNNTVTVPIVIANASDLGIDGTGTPDPVLIGQELTYSLVVTNNGPSDATDPVVVDKLPAGVTYVPADSAAGDGSNLVYDASANTVTVDLSKIIGGSTQTITIAVIPSVSGQIINTAVVSDTNEIDPDLTNNTSTIVTQVSPADIGVVVNNPADPLFIGQDATYQIVVSNAGPAVATNVLLNDAFTGGGSIVSASAGSISGMTVTGNLGSLQSGQSITVTIVVDPTTSGSLINSAGVMSDEIDPDPNNNTSSSSNLVSPVDLAIGITSSASTVLIHNEIAYFETVTNAGPATATNVLVTSALPSGSVLDSVVASQGGSIFKAASTLLTNLGSLAPGASATITFIITSNTVETATLAASVTSDDFDTDTSNNAASASASVVNLPGVIFFPNPIAAVPENGGAVTLTLQRSFGSLGTVSVNYATENDSAIAGVNYVASAGTVTFAAGQTTATITIPVLDDGIINGNTIFLVNLSSPTGGASLGQSEAAVTVVNTDRDTIPPVVTNLSVTTSHNQIVGFVINFDEGMNPILASFVGNYQVFLTNGANAQSAVGIAQAVYNASTDSVTLIPTSPLPYNHFYKVVANGSTATALTDLAGNVLSGSNGPGTDYVAYYGQGTNLKYTDSHNNAVTINLTGGGTLAIFRSSTGDATTINLLGIVPHHSKLTGSVKKLGKTSTGHTSIGTITGFEKFGYVNSSLTTPSFYVGSEVVTTDNTTISTPVSTSSVSAASIPASGTETVTYQFTDFGPSTLTSKKKTPSGPLGLNH